FAAMLEDPQHIRFLLEKAWHLATTGRPGPVWLDIPVNYQGMYIDTDSLPGYDPTADDAALPPPVAEDTIRRVGSLVAEAQRPVFRAAHGRGPSGGYQTFRKAAE